MLAGRLLPYVGAGLLGAAAATVAFTLAPEPKVRAAQERVTDIEASQVVGAILLYGPIVRRWDGPGRVRLVGGDAQDSAYLDQVLAAINEILAGTGTALSRSDAEAAEVHIHIAPRAEWDGFARVDLATVGVPLTARGYGQGQSGAGAAFVGATLFVDPTQFVDDPVEQRVERQRTIIHELAHLLGFRNHNPLDRDSVVYAAGPGRRSTAIAFSELDAKLLRFLYRHLRPGDDPAAVKRAFEEHWDAER